MLVAFSSTVCISHCRCFILATKLRKASVCIVRPPFNCYCSYSLATFWQLVNCFANYFDNINKKSRQAALHRSPTSLIILFTIYSVRQILYSVDNVLRHAQHMLRRHCIDLSVFHCVRSLVTGIVQQFLLHLLRIMLTIIIPACE